MSDPIESAPETRNVIHASVVLQKLHDEAPSGHFTLDWLMSKLEKQSFGLLMLILAIIATIPGLSFIGGLLLLVPAFQMTMARAVPAFPRWMSARPLPTRHLGKIAQHAINALKFLEKVIYPRGHLPAKASKRIVGIAVVLLSLRLISNPIPLSNILPAILIALISLAYTEEDGLMLPICLLAGFVALGIDLAVLWQTLDRALAL